MSATTTRNRKPAASDPIAQASEVRIGRDPEVKLEDLFRSDTGSADGYFQFNPSKEERELVEKQSTAMREHAAAIINNLHLHAGKGRVTNIFRDRIVTDSPAAAYFLEQMIAQVKPIGVETPTSMGTNLWSCSRLNYTLKQMAMFIGIVDVFVTATGRPTMSVTTKAMQTMVYIWKRDTTINPETGSDWLSNQIDRASAALRTYLQRQSGVSV